MCGRLETGILNERQVPSAGNTYTSTHIFSLLSLLESKYVNKYQNLALRVGLR